MIKKPKLLVRKTSVKLAEFIGIMLGDGNSSKYGKGYMVRITGNITDKEHLIKHIKPLMYDLFKVNVGIYYYKGKNAIQLNIGNKIGIRTYKSIRKTRY